MQSVQVSRLLWISTALICQEVVVRPFLVIESLTTIELARGNMNGHQKDHAGNNRHKLLHDVLMYSNVAHATSSLRADAQMNRVG